MEALRIRQERISRGWTQQYVATKIGLTRTAAHDIEIGKQLPSFCVLVKLEDLFGMDYRDLFNIPQRQLRVIEKEPGGNRAKSSASKE